MKTLVRWMCLSWLAGWVTLSAHGEFSSLHIFGDGACTTTNNETGGHSYYGKRFCDGRIWIEVLAQRQGLPYQSSNNWSYFGYESGFVMTNLAKYAAPADANTALFVVWVCDADYVDFLTSEQISETAVSTNLPAWTNAANRFLTNHLAVIQRLYAKGARTLVMPPAVDITKIPSFTGIESPTKAFIRQRITDFNLGLTNVFNQAKASLPGLTIYSPDFFSLLDRIIAQPKAYGFTNSADAAYEVLDNTATNGPGTNFVFWDAFNPSSKAHMHMADLTQQLLSPARLGQLSRSQGTNSLALANVPLGRNGLLEGTTNFLSWSTVTNFSSTNLTQTILFPAAGPSQFYRLRFPFAWRWP